MLSRKIPASGALKEGVKIFRKDPKVFLDVVGPLVRKFVNKTDSVGKKVNAVLVCKMVRLDPTTGEIKDVTIAHFRSRTHSVISEEDMKREYEKMKAKILKSISEYLMQGGGWILHGIEELEIFITKYNPLDGKSYKPLPDFVKNKKAVINM